MEMFYDKNIIEKFKNETNFKVSKQKITAWDNNNQINS